MMYIVTVVKDIYEAEYNSGVEVAGVFDDVEKAYEAKVKVENWLKENEYEDWEIFISPVAANHISWYEIEEDI